MTILLLHGPNLDRLGKRQPEIYGTTTLADIQNRVADYARERGQEVDARQSNHEGQLVEWVHEAADNGWAVIVNAGALTHTSVALRDALAEIADGAGYVEVHLSNVYGREEFRHHSYLAAAARGVIAGLGVHGYFAAVDYFSHADPVF